MSTQVTTPTPDLRADVWSRKDLTAIEPLSVGELTTLLDTAAAFKTVGTREIKKVPALRGQTMVNFSSSPAPARASLLNSPRTASAPT